MSNYVWNEEVVLTNDGASDGASYTGKLRLAGGRLELAVTAYRNDTDEWDYDGVVPVEPGDIVTF